MDKCKTNFRTFHSQFQLLEHLRTHHGFILTIKCNICNYETDDRGKLSRHFGYKHPKARDDHDHQFLAFELASEGFLKETSRKRRDSGSNRREDREEHGVGKRRKEKDEKEKEDRKEAEKEEVATESKDDLKEGTSESRVEEELAYGEDADHERRGRVGDRRGWGCTRDRD